MEARRGGTTYHPADLPTHVAQFLCVSQGERCNGRLIDISREDFDAAGLKYFVWQVVTIEATVQRSEKTVTRERIRAARVAIRRNAQRRAA